MPKDTVPRAPTFGGSTAVDKPTAAAESDSGHPCYGSRGGPSCRCGESARMGLSLGLRVVHHGIQADSIALVEPRGIPVTSSGKVQRGACRQQFLDRGLQTVAEYHAPLRIAPTEFWLTSSRIDWPSNPSRNRQQPCVYCDH